MKEKLKIGALISGGGSNLQAIIDACRDGSLPAEIVFVGTDNPDAGGLKRAEKESIPTFITDYGKIIRNWKTDPNPFTIPGDADLESILEKQKLFPEKTEPGQIEAFFRTRIKAEEALLRAMSGYRFDLLVLAGFMRTLTPYFIDRINSDRLRPRIMNIHPAILPSFPGVNGYEDTFEYGCKVGGCTVHFIDYGEDSGPIIGQRAFAIEPSDDLDAVKAKGLALEWSLYPECIRLFAEDCLHINNSGPKTTVRISSKIL